MKEDRSTDFERKDGETSFSLSRREFLKAVGGGIIIFFSTTDLNAQERRPPGHQDLPADFNAFLRIGADGRVTCFTGKIEMGQGIVTSLAQMLADELDAVVCVAACVDAAEVPVALDPLPTVHAVARRRTTTSAESRRP